ncbi:jg6700 [Pararge aegeria aegeria]|uniref:Jg6700 protein n=1 Tax=Pararge aegeria aegeria TaxID=348720 RepID=A0A8S4SEB6_9NEOP|nr:jg6700 [Pararge aegeria aegeria]
MPPKHLSLEFEKFTPFGTYEFKHTIKKRQIARSELPPAANEVIALADDPLKIPITPLLDKIEVKEGEKLPAEVLITSVVEPFEPGKPISFLLPVDSEVVIKPAVKDVATPIPFNVDAPVDLEPRIQPEVVAPLPNAIVNITPKPIGIPPPQEIKLLESDVDLNTPIESTIPPIPPVMPIPEGKPIPLEESPVISPVINSIPIAPFVYTNIKGIPFYIPAGNIIPFITPGAVPIPEAIVPPSPPPVIKEIPVVKEEIPVVVKEEVPPVVKEEPPPNFFVKSSRFVLYFGSMMLQMLSRFVNGQANLSQIPLPPPFPGLQ